jgi:membrane protein YdbS with pleckstrin-like domain
MIDAVQQALLRWLRVPPEPDPPAGAPGSVRVFRAARNFLWYNVFGWVLKQAAALWGLVVGLGALSYAPQFPMDEWVRVAEAIGIGVFVLQIPTTLVGVLLDYRMRWYIVTDRSLRIREGIWKVREKTMSFANIQNLGVKQGPLQRLLGISDLEVKSAGGGESKSSEARKKGESLHTGYFHGVDNAEEIKGLVLERLRRLRDSGLGDPEEAAAAAAAAGAAALGAGPGASVDLGLAGGAGSPADLLRGACRELLGAARELRAAAGR